ncbi:MAG: aromatic hydrocarbon degradation protein, partial [Desulforhopalus sp.]|nr:aromatic hydrocarbon degradation protein [Desulforhopalus sp.]
MKKKIALLALAGVFAAGIAYGSAFRVPEQSINSTALAGAYIANANGADASYFNPANMSWAEDRWQVEADLTYINLPHINYEDNRSSFFDGSSDTENFFLPQLHVVSKAYNNLRFGFSLTVPFGLSKKWDEPFPAVYAKEFTLEVIEANPTVAYKVNNKMSFGAGIRILKADGKVKSTATPPFSGPLSLLSRDLDGDTIELGYNLAMTVKPIDKWTLAATYRSRVDLNLDGSATLVSQSLIPALNGLYDGDAEVTVVTPAVLSIGTSYSFDKTTVELTWDRTYWSRYSHLDFDYNGTLHPALQVFDDRIDKDWDDADAFRIGITHKCTDK